MKTGLSSRTNSSRISTRWNSTTSKQQHNSAPTSRTTPTEFGKDSATPRRKAYRKRYEPLTDTTTTYKSTDTGKSHTKTLPTQDPQKRVSTTSLSALQNASTELTPTTRRKVRRTLNMQFEKSTYERSSGNSCHPTSNENSSSTLEKATHHYDNNSNEQGKSTPQTESQIKKNNPTKLSALEK